MGPFPNFSFTITSIVAVSSTGSVGQLTPMYSPDGSALLCPGKESMPREVTAGYLAISELKLSKAHLSGVCWAGGCSVLLKGLSPTVTVAQRALIVFARYLNAHLDQPKPATSEQLLAELVAVT